MIDSPFIREVSADDFDSVVLEGSRERPVLVDFWADWCAPCRILMPLLARLAEEFQGKFLLAKVNTEEQRDLAANYGIRSLPTVKLFRQGQPVAEFLGALPESEIRAFLDQHIPRASDGLLARAEQLMQQGDEPAAASLIQQAYAGDPGNPRAGLAFARLQSARGNWNEAQEVIAALPPDEQQKPEVAALRGLMEFERIAHQAPPVATLEERLTSQPDDSEARYQLAAHRVLAGEHEAALELLYQLLLRDRKFRDEAARNSMLLIFGMLDNDSDLVKRYRGKLFNALH